MAPSSSLSKPNRHDQTSFGEAHEWDKKKIKATRQVSLTDKKVASDEFIAAALSV
jgi:hypothetical protein